LIFSFCESFITLLYSGNDGGASAKDDGQTGGFTFDFETTPKGKAAKLQQKKQQQAPPQLSQSMLKELERQQQMWKQKQEQGKQEEKGQTPVLHLISLQWS